MIKRNLAVIICVLVFFSFAADVLAQEGRGNGRLKGTIVDSKGNPIKDAKIKLKYFDFERNLETISDEKGKWIFIGLGPGGVSVNAEKEGFVTGGIQLAVKGIERNPTQKIILKTPSEVPTDMVAKEDKESKNDLKKANSLFNDKKFERALELYKKFTIMKPNKHEICIYLAHCYLGLKKYNDAISEYNSVLKKINAKTPNAKNNKFIVEIYSGIAEVYMNQNNLKDAEIYFKKAIAINPKDHILTYTVAEILFNGGKTSDAIKYYELTIKNNPSWPNSYKQIGYAYLNKGDIKNSIKYLKKYLSLEPDSPDAQGIKDVIKSLQ